MDALSGVSFVFIAAGVTLAVIYILLPLKLWRMADRIKEMNAESKKQTALLQNLCGLPAPSQNKITYAERARAIGDDRGV